MKQVGGLKSSLGKASPYAFVVTILWIGFLLAIGFVETPLRFRAGNVSRAGILSIGHLVFHALNRAEIIFASLLLVTLIFGNTPATTKSAIDTRRMRVVFATIIFILAVQTLLLFTILDQRTLAIIAGEEVGEAAWHTLYVAMDVTKLGLLVLLTALQIRWFNHRQRD